MTAEPQYSRDQDLEQLRCQIRLKIEQARLALRSHREHPESADGAGAMVIEGSDPRIRRQRFYS